MDRKRLNVVEDPGLDGVLRQLVVQHLRQNVQVDLVLVRVLLDFVQFERLREARLFVLLDASEAELLVVDQEVPQQGIGDQHLADAQSAAPVRVAGELLLDGLVLEVLLQVLLGPHFAENLVLH